MKVAVKITSLLLVCTALTSFTSPVQAPGTDLIPESAYRMKTVVIDPGHGGHDQGCSGKMSKEKEVALKISLQLGAMIEKAFPDIKVVYTRKTDVFIELHERAAIANRHKADLFICIHCNANQSTSPYGTETYVMGLHKTDANLSVAKRENDVILMEDNYSDHYDGFNPNDPTAHIIFSLFQHAYMEQSINFAGKVEEQFKHHAGRTSRGVKQAGFLVLWKTSMPAVLIETGFLTNAEEEKFLASGEGQDKIARSVFRAFSAYKSELEGTEVDPDLIVKSTASSSSANQGNATASASSSGSVSEDTYGSGVEFRVQFLAAKELYNSGSSSLKPAGQGVSYVLENGWYKYRSGPYTNYTEAAEKLQILKKAGYPDAFMIAHKNGERMDLQEARALGIR